MKVEVGPFKHEEKIKKCGGGGVWPELNFLKKNLLVKCEVYKI
jgi:hypothetical protein